jgi:hypothetical protein
VWGVALIPDLTVVSGRPPVFNPGSVFPCIVAPCQLKRWCASPASQLADACSGAPTEHRNCRWKKKKVGGNSLGLAPTAMFMRFLTATYTRVSLMVSFERLAPQRPMRLDVRQREFPLPSPCRWV